MQAVPPLLALLAGFMAGSLPTAYLAGRLKSRNLTREGSGNSGATNAARVLGMKWGLAVAVIDIMKVVGVLLAAENLPDIDSALLYGVGFAAILGHVFSPFLGFRGGKGVAATAGAVVYLFPVGAAWALPVFVLTTAVTGYVSLASLLAVGLLPVFMLLLAYLGVIAFSLPLLVFLTGTAAVVIWAHRSNIQRLITGNERRFSRKR